jgi:hypothetical protein
MTSGGFAADPQAIATAAKAFDSQVDPIAQQAQKLDGIKGSASTTGKAYHAQGAAYHDAVTASLDKVVREFSAKAEWVSGALSQAGADYTAGDQSGTSTIAASGTDV